MDGEGVLFVFAHQDDEVGALPWIESEIAVGNRVACVFLTDGGARAMPGIRDKESLDVLTDSGVAAASIAFLGDDARIADGMLALNASHAVNLLRSWIDAQMPNVKRMYSPAWEGGHHDHDAAHAITLAEGARRGILAHCWQFHLYNGKGCIAPFFCVLKPILREGISVRIVRYGLADAWRYATVCWRYRSQRRTWLGLFPELFVRRMLGRSDFVYSSDPAIVTGRPHAGTLLYERLFGVPYDYVARVLEETISSLL